ncbi:MAG: hypothetical protein JJT77_06810 [Crocinitomicaceae bacterium]|nr:hypothetical protein [Crocinitomicaceae bacterium]
MKNWIILCFCCFVLISCRRNELSFTFKGTVTDLTFQNAAQNVNVKLFKFAAGSTFGIIAGETQTDANGNYTIQVSRNPTEKFVLEISSNNYFVENLTIPFSDLKPNEDNVFDMGIHANSWLKFVFKNQNNPAPTDELKILKQGGKSGCPDCCNYNFAFFNGIVDTTFTCVSRAKDSVTIFHWVNGNEQFSEQEFLLQPFDTLLYEIIY